jgi:short subunit fatty acids transporter
LLTVSRCFMNVANRVLWRMVIILKANKVNLFVSSVCLFSGTSHRTF